MSTNQEVIAEMETCSVVHHDNSYPLWSLFDDSAACVAQLNLDMRLTGGNAGFADVFNLAAETIPGRPLVELVHASVRDMLARRLTSLIHGERSRFTERVMSYVGTSRSSIELTGIAVTNDAGRIDSLIVLVEPEPTPECAMPCPAGVRKPLTRMETLVLEGVAAGMSTVQLAAKLFLSRGGVEYHVSALMKNLGAANRSELVSKAYTTGLFGLGSWPPRVISNCLE